MHPLAKRIVLLLSLFCTVLGFFLLGYNLQIVSERAMATALNLWPATLMVAGVMLIVDSAKKQRFTRASGLHVREFPLPMPANELSCRVQFSYGRLFVGSTDGPPGLVTEHIGHAIEPSVNHETLGGVSDLSIAMTQPLFPAHFQLRNTWRLALARGFPTRLACHLHEADLGMDLRGLSVESLELKTDSGRQEILLGRLCKKLSVDIFSSSTDLTIVLPSKMFLRVRFLNPFCRVDYPQGDLEKREDGSLVSTAASDNTGSIEINIDGPLKNIVLDIEET